MVETEGDFEGGRLYADYIKSCRRLRRRRTGPPMPIASDPNDYAARLADAAFRLAEADRPFAALVTRFGPCTLAPYWERSPFEALIRAVAYQQLQGRAAAAILGRFLALFDGRPFPSPADIGATEDEALRAVGFSRAKIAAIRAIAGATQDGTVPSRTAAEAMDEAELIQRLTTIRGIGRWTVEMLLIFTLGRLDVFPLDDFGIRAGLRVAFGAAELPSKREMAEAAERWRPYRSVASWYLWRAAELAPRPPAQA
jgi:DNA-3-methyladenine glycosylase II